jgi:hypothetical protein
MTFFLVTTPVVKAEFCKNIETRYAGAPAAELYTSLNIAETPVSDEHGGTVFATAKYGKLIGCQKDLNSNNIECWIIQPPTHYNCD